MQVKTALGCYSIESPDALGFNELGELATVDDFPSSLDESEPVAEDLTSEDEISSEEVSSDYSSDTTSEELEVVGYTEVVSSVYSPEDLVHIEECLHVTICLLFFIVIYIVCRISRSLLDILGF